MKIEYAYKGALYTKEQAKGTGNITVPVVRVSEVRKQFDELALKLYKHNIMECNGWSEEELNDNLTDCQLHDGGYQKILMILNKELGLE